MKVSVLFGLLATATGRIFEHPHAQYVIIRRSGLEK